MLIHFERTGGFAGMVITGTVDTAQLPVEEASDLYRLVDESDFFNLPQTLIEPTTAADQLQYRVAVERDGRAHTVETTDDAAPETLQPLLRRLTVLARSAGRPLDRDLS